MSDGKHIDLVSAYVRSDWPYIFLNALFLVHRWPVFSVMLKMLVLNTLL